MWKPLKRSFLIITLLTSVVSLSGCTLIFQKGRRVDVDKISTLKNDLAALEREKSNLEKAQEQLQGRLKNEIKDSEVKVEMLERGLVITFVAEVLFDSGKAELRQGTREKLDKVARVLNTTVKDLNVGIEGHTDNVPIKHSGWKSNWELSTARALSVLHKMVNEHGVDPTRLSATGFGEYKPVAGNDTDAGRQKNRRVEIVILPETTKEGRK